MILLTFGSAVKYILTLMLAVLGIIPYEDVNNLSNDGVKTTEAYEIIKADPLDLMAAREVSPDLLLPADRLGSASPASIPLRSNYGLQHGAVFDNPPLTVHLELPVETMIEIAREQETMKRYFLLSSESLEAISLEKVFVLGGGS